MTVNKDDIRRTLDAAKLLEWLDVEIDLSRGNDPALKADRWAFRYVLKEIERGSFDLPPDAKDAEIERLQGILNKMSVIASYSGWISVKDRLPDKPGYYLTYSSIGGIWATEYGVFRQKLEFRDALGFPQYPAPTHWMPQPEPPKEVELG